MYFKSFLLHVRDCIASVYDIRIVPQTCQKYFITSHSSNFTSVGKTRGQVVIRAFAVVVVDDIVIVIVVDEDDDVVVVVGGGVVV